MYHAALSAKAAASKRQPDPQRLPRLDAWFCAELPRSISQRQPEPYLTHAELAQIVEYKLLRGKFRIGLASNVKTKNSPTDVETTSKVAFQIITNSIHDAENDNPTTDSILKAMHILDKGDNAKGVKGLAAVGPATALIILSVLHPSIPYFSDEAFSKAVDGKVVYTPASSRKFIDAMRSLAQEKYVSVRELEKSFFSETTLKQLGVENDVSVSVQDADPHNDNDKSKPKKKIKL